MSVLIRQMMLMKNGSFLPSYMFKANHSLVTTVRVSQSNLYSDRNVIKLRKLPRSLLPLDNNPDRMSQNCHCRQSSSMSRSSCSSFPGSSGFSNLKRTGYIQQDKYQNIGSYPNSPVYCQTRHIAEDAKTTALTIWTGLVHLKSSPLPALVLGFSGLVPFISAPAYMVFTQLYQPYVVFAHVAYGAVILSFLGGIRWGFTLPEESTEKADWKNLSYSVVPSLVAWTGLLFPLPISLLTVMTGLAGAAYFDTMMQGYPPWFKALRFTLTFIAVLSLWTSFVCRFLLEEVGNSDTKLNLSES